MNTMKAHWRKVANDFIAFLKEEGEWEAGWNERAGVFDPPVSVASGKPYRGGNCINLSMRQRRMSYESNRWGTFKTLKAAGYSVMKGQKGTRIVFFSNTKRIPLKVGGVKIKDEDGKQKYETVHLATPAFRSFWVFNLHQTVEFSPPAYPVENEPQPMDNGSDEMWLALATEGLESYVREDFGPRGSPCYDLQLDEIYMPPRSRFESEQRWIESYLHELFHATGHPDRLNRQTLVKGASGSWTMDYAREELRAQIGSWVIASRMGVKGLDLKAHFASYVNAWIKELEHNPEEIHKASLDAWAGADYVLSRAREAGIKGVTDTMHDATDAEA